MLKFMISLLLSLYSENSIFFLIHHSMQMYINSNTLFNEYRFKRTEKSKHSQVYFKNCHIVKFPFALAQLFSKFTI